MHPNQQNPLTTHYFALKVRRGEDMVLKNPIFNLYNDLNQFREETFFQFRDGHVATP